MSNFALLPIFSGFQFDVPHKHIGFAPIIGGNFKCMWNLGSGWGDFIKNENQYKIIVADGVLELNGITLGDLDTVKTIHADGKEINFSQNHNTIFFENTIIRKKVIIEV